MQVLEQLTQRFSDEKWLLNNVECIAMRVDAVCFLGNQILQYVLCASGTARRFPRDTRVQTFTEQMKQGFDCHADICSKYLLRSAPHHI